MRSSYHFSHTGQSLSFGVPSPNKDVEATNKEKEQVLDFLQQRVDAVRPELQEGVFLGWLATDYTSLLNSWAKPPPAIFVHDYFLPRNGNESCRTCAAISEENNICIGKIRANTLPKVSLISLLFNLAAFR